MKIIDQSASNQAASSGNRTRLVNALRPVNRRPDVSALAGLSSALDRLLDDHYVLYKNLSIKDAQIEIPAILIGPTGMVVFFPSEAGGVFRNQGETWEKLKSRGQRYAPAHPNPLSLAREMASALAGYLDKQQLECRNLEPVVFFSNPEIHVDSIRPAVKLIMPDSLERYIAGVLNGKLVYDRASIRRILNALMVDTQDNEAPLDYDFQDGFALKDFPEVKSDRWKPFPNLPHEEPVIANKVPFTRRQWAMLMLLILTNIVVLTTLVVVVMAAG